MHRFRDKQLLRRALTHRSILPETGGSAFEANETLEFLGDAVLDLIVAQHLYQRFPDLREGDLSKMKSMVVSGQNLHQVARSIQLGDCILMSSSEARNGGRRRDSILEDTLEALVAALYIDGGIKAAQRFVERHILPKIETIAREKVDINYKSQLLEYAQARGIASPSYRVIKERGPDHAKEFEIEVWLKNAPIGHGKGHSKKEAQQDAARDAISRFSS
jgi:ribonuclease-3